MKRILLLAIISFVITSFANAQDCKMCGEWKGAFKDVFPSGDEYRVDVTFTIQGNKKFDYWFKPVGFGVGERGDNESVTFVDDACNDHFIKYYVKGEDDDWQTGQKFKGRRIGNCIMHSYSTLEIKDEKTIIYRRLGRDYFYYDIYGDYIGKEWKDGPDDSFVCILHQLDN